VATTGTAIASEPTAARRTPPPLARAISRGSDQDRRIGVRKTAFGTGRLPLLVLEGVLVRITFANDETGYSVGGVAVSGASVRVRSASPVTTAAAGLSS